MNIITAQPETWAVIRSDKADLDGAALRVVAWALTDADTLEPMVIDLDGAEAVLASEWCGWAAASGAQTTDVRIEFGPRKEN
jgi:hypothetical protein